MIYILTSSDIFSGLISSTFVPDLYGLMRRILCLIIIEPYCTMTVPLVKHWIITNGFLMAFFIVMQRCYRAWLLSLGFKSLSSSLEVLVSSFTICVGCVLMNSCLLLLTYLFLIHRIFIRRIISRTNLNYPGL